MFTWSMTFAAALLAVAPTASVDSPASPTPQVVASESGEAFVRFDLPGDKPWDESRCRITAFEVGLDGKDHEIWRTEGWYAFKCWLSHDGHLLARLGPWSFGSEPEDTDLAVAFYQDGRLLRAWSTRELVQDDSRVERTVSHYVWLRSSNFEETWNKSVLTIETLDDLRWTFDLATGEVVGREHVSHAPESKPEPSTVVEGDPVVADEIRAYYTALSARDWTGFAEHFHPGALLSTRWTPAGAAKPILMMSSVAEFVARAPEGPGSQPIFEEWPTDIDIYRDGDMAMALVRYGVRFGTNEALQKWTGVDAITLIRHEDRWRITSIAWSGD
jgi:hypothetical protein